MPVTWRVRAALGVAVVTAVGWLPAAAGPAAARAAAGIPAPVHHGTLRVTGLLRDGGTVAAAGLSWRPAVLPRGDKLLSFEVAYQWAACDTNGRRCVPGADTAATPFAARHYLAGQRDTGKRLMITETAAEVVETDPATFTFRVIRASVRHLTAAAVRAYPARQAPVTEFADGTPEPRTTSAEEYFQVNPPQYAAADGIPAQRYRVDGGRWHPLPASKVFYTGKLRTGPHTVAVRTADKAGATTIRFGWRVAPLPAPLACQPRPGQACWYPPHLDSGHRPMRWDWQIGLVKPLQRTGASAVDLYDTDGFLTTRAQVRAIRTSWQASTLRHPRTICYLDLAWEDYRPDATPGRYFPADTLGNVYFGFPQERWVDFRQLGALKPMLDERLRMCASKGFDAVELDDIDSFDPPSTTGFHLTPGDAQNYLAYAFNEIHRLGLTGLWKNSPYLSWWGRDYADGAVVEECYRYHQCFASSLRGSSQYGITCTGLAGRTPCGWDDFSTDVTPNQPTGKWVGEAEYAQDHYVCNPGQTCSHKRDFSTYCQIVYRPAYGFSAVKFDVNLSAKMFYPCPSGA
jgi:Glycoside-hydrolase family GH114